MKGVYKITNNHNEKYYIGSSSDIQKRWFGTSNGHIYLAFRTNTSEYNKILYVAFRKYAKDKDDVINHFTFEVLEECDNHYEREQYYIDNILDWTKVYNVNPIASAPPKKQGEDNNNSLLNNEVVLKIRGYYGKLGAKETYNKINIEFPMTYRVFTSVWYGTAWQHIGMEVYTKENKKKYKQAKRGVVKLSKSGDFIEEYDSGAEAGRENKPNASQILKVCKGQGKTAGGFVWMFSEDYYKT